MQFTTVRSKEKDYDIYLKSENDIYFKSEKLVHNQQDTKKMFPSYLEVEKTGSQLFRAWFTASRSTKKMFPSIWKWKKKVPSYFEQDKHCCSYLEREKSGSLLFGN